jgi:hypothetical protein
MNGAQKKVEDSTDALVAEIHWAIQTAIESPAERADAIAACVAQLRELALRDAEALMLAREETLARRTKRVR